MAKITMRMLPPTIGAMVAGVDLCQPLSHEENAQIRGALRDHKLIFFEDHHIPPVAHRDVAPGFGTLLPSPL